jgi:hypothetical protein
LELQHATTLENNIYETRKCRINASERLKCWDDFLYKINVYYSIFVVILSIWNLNQESSTNNKISLALLILSVIAFSFTLVVSALNHKERSLNLKSNYILLDKLYSELQLLKSKPTMSAEELHSIDIAYKDLLTSTENHESIDYYSYLLTNEKKLSSFSEERQANIKTYIRFFKWTQRIFKILLIIAPLLLPFLISLIDSYISGLR